MSAEIEPASEFPWGAVTWDHVFGPYVIREYVQKEIHNSSNNGRTLFYAYHDGKSMHESWHSLEQAIIGAIAKVHDGLNSQAAHYFFRMIDIEEPSQ